MRLHLNCGAALAAIVEQEPNDLGRPGLVLLGKSLEKPGPGPETLPPYASTLP